LLRRFRAASLEKAAGFDIGRVTDKYEALLKEIVTGF